MVKSNSGLVAKFTFQKSGWVSSSKNEVIGEIKDENNKKIKSMFGRWDEAIYLGESRQTVCGKNLRVPKRELLQL